MNCKARINKVTKHRLFATNSDERVGGSPGLKDSDEVMLKE